MAQESRPASCLKPCVSAVKLNAERAADDFHLNTYATIVYIYILLSDEV